MHQPTIEKLGAFEKMGTGWTKPENFVGNGPFYLKKHQINSVIEVLKSSTYWDASTVKLEEFLYPIDAAYTEERAYRSGFLHITQTVSADRIDFLENYPDALHLNHISEPTFIDST